MTELRVIPDPGLKNGCFPRDITPTVKLNPHLDAVIQPYILVHGPGSAIYSLYLTGSAWIGPGFTVN